MKARVMLSTRVVGWFLLPLIGSGEIPKAPGRLVDIGGANLHIHCSGNGSPGSFSKRAFLAAHLTGRSFSLALQNSLGL